MLQLHNIESTCHLEMHSDNKKYYAANTISIYFLPFRTSVKILNFLLTMPAALISCKESWVSTKCINKGGGGGAMVKTTS